MYIVYKGIIKNMGQRPSLRRKVLSTFIVWLYPPLPLGSTLCRWALPSVVGLCLPLLGSALHRWVMPSVVGGFCPPSLCVNDGRYTSLLGGGWLIRMAVGQYLSSTGGTHGRKGESEP